MKYLYRILLLVSIFRNHYASKYFRSEWRKDVWIIIKELRCVSIWTIMNLQVRIHIFFHNVEFCSNNNSGPMARTLSVPQAIVDEVLIIHVSSLIVLRHLIHELLNALRFPEYWISLRSHFEFYISLGNLFWTLKKLSKIDLFNARTFYPRN